MSFSFLILSGKESTNCMPQDGPYRDPPKASAGSLTYNKEHDCFNFKFQFDCNGYLQVCSKHYIILFTPAWLNLRIAFISEYALRKRREKKGLAQNDWILDLLVDYVCQHHVLFFFSLSLSTFPRGCIDWLTSSMKKVRRKQREQQQQSTQ